MADDQASAGRIEIIGPGSELSIVGAPGTDLGTKRGGIAEMA
jgi:hypothetical protein